MNDATDPGAIAGLADSGFSHLTARLVNRVLRDYPMAMSSLAAHAGKTIAIVVGPLRARLRIVDQGGIEPRGAFGDENIEQADVEIVIPPTRLPALARRDEAALASIAFRGDGELAQTLSLLARSLEWDIEEDISRALGGSHAADALAHRAVDSAKRLDAWRGEARERLIENLAEYLVHERQAFMTAAELAALREDNIALRDAVARLDARIARLASPEHKH